MWTKHPSVQATSKRDLFVCFKSFILPHSPIHPATLLGCHDPFVQSQSFDLVVVDEASQATEPSMWCALFKTKKFVLFGDTNQLPPLVRHPKAIAQGMGTCLVIYKRIGFLYIKCDLRRRICTSMLEYNYPLTLRGK